MGWQVTAFGKVAYGVVRRVTWHGDECDQELDCSMLSLSGETGLEVCAGKDTTPKEAMQSGLWVPCDPVPGAITVNIGDALQYWSDGRLKPIFHRVRLPGKDEYQIGHLIHGLKKTVSVLLFEITWWMDTCLQY